MDVSKLQFMFNKLRPSQMLNQKIAKNNSKYTEKNELSILFIFEKKHKIFLHYDVLCGIFQMLLH